MYSHDRALLAASCDYPLCHRTLGVNQSVTIISPTSTYTNKAWSAAINKILPNSTPTNSPKRISLLLSFPYLSFFQPLFYRQLAKNEWHRWDTRGTPPLRSHPWVKYLPYPIWVQMLTNTQLLGPPPRPRGHSFNSARKTYQRPLTHPRRQAQQRKLHIRRHWTRRWTSLSRNRRRNLNFESSRTWDQKAVSSRVFPWRTRSPLCRWLA